MPEHGTQTRRRAFRLGLYQQAAEFMFILLPLIILFLKSWKSNGGDKHFIQSHEWSLAAAILFGQTITRVASAYSHSRAKPWEKVALTVAILLVLGLIPSLVVLGDLYSSTAELPNRAVYTHTQLVLFCASSFAFLVFGAAAHAMSATSATPLPPSGA